MNEIARQNPRPAHQPSTYRFADLTLHIGHHRLERHGSPIELGRLTYALLLALVESAPNVLSHDDLVRLVWGGRSTAPETVTQRVKLLRDALGDDAQRPLYVGLVRGGGYRLIPAVERMEAPSAPVQQHESAAKDTARASGVAHALSAARRRSWSLAVIMALGALAIVAIGTLVLRDPSPRPSSGSTIAVLPIENLSPSALIRHETTWHGTFTKRSSENYSTSVSMSFPAVPSGYTTSRARGHRSLRSGEPSVSMRSWRDHPVRRGPTSHQPDTSCEC
jgi:DNA-binding winged helix-turn-helix (wHTH) protein